MSESKHNPVPQENTVIFDPPADSAGHFEGVVPHSSDRPPQQSDPVATYLPCDPDQLAEAIERGFRAGRMYQQRHSDSDPTDTAAAEGSEPLDVLHLLEVGHWKHHAPRRGCAGPCGWRAATEAVRAAYASQTSEEVQP